jgi:hypothetical protein
MERYLGGNLKIGLIAGMPYFGAVTGDANEPGANGALMQRHKVHLQNQTSL